MDLGADGWQTFRFVTFQLRSALPPGALLAFALSFDEVVVTIFTSGARRCRSGSTRTSRARVSSR